MALADKLRYRVAIQVKTTTQTALGETAVWKPVETRYANVVPLDAKAQAIYQQLKSEVSHKVTFRGDVAIALGSNRLLWRGKVLEPVGPVQNVDNSTIVAVKEV